MRIHDARRTTRWGICMKGGSKGYIPRQEMRVGTPFHCEQKERTPTNESAVLGWIERKRPTLRPLGELWRSVHTQQPQRGTLRSQWIRRIRLTTRTRIGRRMRRYNDLVDERDCGHVVGSKPFARDETWEGRGQSKSEIGVAWDECGLRRGLFVAVHRRMGWECWSVLFGVVGGCGLVSFGVNDECCIISLPCIDDGECCLFGVDGECHLFSSFHFIWSLRFISLFCSDCTIST